MLTGKYNQRGGFLVGVLIAMVVAGIGLFALLQLNGKMTSGISASKARAEAMQWAQQKSQELTATIETGQHDLYFTSTRSDWDTPATPDDTKEGKNASFEQKWWVRDAPDGGNYKQLLVRVSWADEAGKSQNVSLNNFIVFKDPSTISGIWEDETGGSSERPLKTRMNVGIEKEEDGTGYNLDDNPRAGDEDPDWLDTPNPNLHTGINSKGNWEIYTGTGANANVVLTAFGGIIHQIRGKIHFEETNITQDDLDEMAVIATSPAYCEYPVNPDDCPSDLSGNCVEYVCFVPGDCANETVSTAFNACKEHTDTDLGAHLASIKALELNGGWYGKVGLFGVPVTPFDDIITGDSCDDPARLYISPRTCDSGEICTDLMENLNTIFGPGECEYQKYCTFQDSSDEGVSNYTGYISHCVGNPEINEILDGYCDDGTPYGIYENEGINGSYTNNHFWLIDKDVNAKTCGVLRQRFSVSGIIPNDPSPIPPPYLVDHSIARPLLLDGSEPKNTITELRNMGLNERFSPPDL